MKHHSIRNFSRFTLFLLFGILVNIPSFSVAKSATQDSQPKAEVNSQAQWKKKMQSLYQSLTELLTDVSSDQRYYDSKNSSRIEREIKTISALSHELNMNSKDAFQADPSLQIFSGLLAGETTEAYSSFRAGHKVYARDIMRSIPTNCLACHSRNATGPNFSSLPLEPNAPLKPLEQAEFFAATRQFDRAVELFQKVIRGKLKPKSESYDLEKATHDALLIAVRIKHDSSLAKSIAQSVIDNPDSPQFLTDDAVHWKKSTEDWVSEGAREIKTEEGMHAEALRLIAHARANQSYAIDHSEDITYLRASAVLFDLIQLAPNGKYLSDALLLLGMCYEVINPRRMEDLHNIYYEACIQHSPHTEIARTCYRRYEQSIYAGFTGSSGTHLPEDIKQKLLELWSLAMKIKGDL